MLIFVMNTDEGCLLYDKNLKLICEAVDDSMGQIVPSIACTLNIKEDAVDTQNMHWVASLEEARTIVDAETA